MADFNAGEVLAQLASGLTKFSESVKVIGEPIEAAGKVVIPAVVARTGFGAGGGWGKKPAEEEGGPPQGGGGGGGGGVMLTPVFLIVDAEGERLLMVPDVPNCVNSVVDTIKGAIEGLKPKHAKEE